MSLSVRPSNLTQSKLVPNYIHDFDRLFYVGALLKKKKMIFQKSTKQRNKIETGVTFVRIRIRTFPLAKLLKQIILTIITNQELYISSTP